MTRILLVGCGRMGGALLRGWHGDPVFHVSVIDPAPAAADLSWATRLNSIADAEAQAVDALVLAVKPQVLPDLTPDYRALAARAALCLSIAAGIRIADLTAWLGTPRVVRAMPNLPAAIGAGVTALVAETGDVRARDLAERLMRAVGETVWLAEEAQIDAATAISGSGPAYVARFLDALTEAGVARGLSRDAALALARATLTGTARLLADPESEARALAANVTSPGGTTAAALAILDREGGLAALVADAVAAAVRRAGELAAPGKPA